MSQAKCERRSRLGWVRIGDMQVSPDGQREYREHIRDKIAADFDLDKLGYPVVNERDGYYWIIDGQHRVAALKLNGFSEDDSIECEVYDGLTEEEEAELFLGRDERTKIGTFDRFRISIKAGRGDETQIARVVERAGYKISRSESTGSIRAIGALRFVHGLSPVTLARAVTILGAAFDGDPDAFGGDLLKGMGLVCHRYDGALEDEKAIEQLRTLQGATLALGRKAEALKLKTGHTKHHCMAGAIVEALNRGRGGQKLESWWR